MERTFGEYWVCDQHFVVVRYGIASEVERQIVPDSQSGGI